MARTFVDEGADIFRVCVTSKKSIGNNPAYDWRTARETGEAPFLYSDTETVTNYYGPYKTLGTATAQLSFRMQYRPTQDEVRNFPGVVSGHVEKANVVWEVAGGLK